MNFTRQSPPAYLASFVKCFWMLQVCKEDLPLTQLSYPYGAFELIYFMDNPNKMRWHHSGKEFYEPKFFYAGQLTQPYELKFEQPCICAGISMQPWAGNLLFNIPANHFKDALVELPDLPGTGKLRDDLLACDNTGLLFYVFEKFVAERIAHNSLDPIMMPLAKSIMQSPGHTNSLTGISDIGLCRRRVEQRFAESVGLTMSMFLKKVRFQQAVRLISEKKENENLSDICFDLGYYDQAHFNHDFKRFSGISPSQYTTNLSKGLNGFFGAVGSHMPLKA